MSSKVKVKKSNKSSNISNDIIQSVKLKPKEFETFINSKSVSELKAMALALDEDYYTNGESAWNNSRYDYLKDRIQHLDPGYSFNVGFTSYSRDSVTLPCFMGSMDKFTPDNSEAMARWFAKYKTGKYSVEEKLDGISGLLSVVDGVGSLYTRGDKSTGRNISNVLPYISGIPKKLPANLTVRGELIVEDEVFQEKYQRPVGSKDKTLFSTGLSMVVGLTGSKNLSRSLRDVNFVAYELINPDGESIDPKTQIKELKKLGFRTVKQEVLPRAQVDSVDDLKELLQSFRSNSPFTIDGIIVQAVKMYDRADMGPSGCPRYAFAFKADEEEQMKKVRVLEVEWSNPKADGAIIPKVIHERVVIDGHEHNNVAANNARWVIENGIGPGAIVLIRKRVTPKIEKVLSPASVVFPNIPYHWGDPSAADGEELPRHIYSNEFTPEMCRERINNFFAKSGGLNVKHIAEATIDKMFAGGINTILKIVAATPDQLTSCGIGSKPSETIVVGIRNVLGKSTKADVIGAAKVMGARNGKRRMKSLFTAIPDVLDLDPEDPNTIERIANVEGFSGESAPLIASRIPYAKVFIDSLSQMPFINFDAACTGPVPTGDSLQGKIYVFSGVRPDKIPVGDSTLEDILKQEGADPNKPSVSTQTSALIVKDPEATTKKITTAIEKGIPVYSVDQFLQMLRDKQL